MGVDKSQRPILASRGVDWIVRSTGVADGSTFSLTDGLFLIDSASTGATFTLPAPRAGALLFVAYRYGTTGSTMTIRTASTSEVIAPTTFNVVEVSSGVGGLQLMGVSTSAWSIVSAYGSGTVELGAST